MSPDNEALWESRPPHDSGKSIIFGAICNLADVVTPVARKEKPATRDASEKDGSRSSFVVFVALLSLEETAQRGEI